MTTELGWPPVTVRETHSGLVVLAGDRAYKVKKPVDLAFLDFRTEAARRVACQREIELNRRLAPDVYEEELASFTRPEANVAEPVIVMRRMPEELRLASLVTAAVDVDDHVRALARLLANFHADAARSAEIDAEGSATRLRYRWTSNLRETQQFCPGLLDHAVHGGIRRLALRYVDGRHPLLEERVRAGMIVDGHGDLTAEDVFCLPDYPRVLDCLEFDDRLRWVDALDDAAFLAMDLERLGRADLAQRFLDWYEEFGAVPAVPSLRHHYVAYRAFVRAKVSCVRARQGVAEAAGQVAQYAQLALAHLQAGEVRLVLVGGAPGTGKSTVAAALADELGFALLSSDAVRRENPATRSRYTPRAKDAVYAELLTRARRALEHGESVIVDATWGEPAWRRLAATLAEESASRLVALECVAAVDLSAARAGRRAATGTDASEADGSVARSLALARQPWPDAVPVDTSGEVVASVAIARRTAGPA